MNNIQVGKLIRTIRTEKGMTQHQLAEKMGITEQAVSKWERGIGSPDISLLSELSQILGVNIEKILSGELKPNDIERGNMKKIKFYVCPDCGGILTSLGEAEISCCGRKLEKLEAQPQNSEHHLIIEEVEDDYYITCAHEMTRSHYISFVAYVTADKLVMTRLYPEQGAEVRIPKMYGGTLYLYCTQHGLVAEKIYKRPYDKKGFHHN